MPVANMEESNKKNMQNTKYSDGLIQKSHVRALLKTKNKQELRQAGHYTPVASKKM